MSIYNDEVRRCTKCGTIKPINEFAKNKQWKKHTCKECIAKKSREIYESNIEYNRYKDARRRFEAKNLMIRIKSKKCFTCGNKYHYSVMNIIKKNGVKIRKLMNKSIKRILEAIDGSTIICTNCYMIMNHTTKSEKKVCFICKNEYDSVCIENKDSIIICSNCSRYNEFEKRILFIDLLYTY